MAAKATIKKFGLQTGTTGTVYATWTWSKKNTEHYQVKWYYDTGNGIWFVGSDSTTTEKQSTYSAPSNAKNVRFYVKPISKKRKVNNKETSYWTASWSTAKTYSFSKNPPTTPPAPSVTIEKFKLTAELDNLNVNATTIQFQIVRSDWKVVKTGTATIRTAHAAYSCTVAAGYEYKVRCRSVKGKTYSAWSEYSENVGTIPAASSGIVTLKALSETSIYVSWYKVTNADNYEVQYTTNTTYFDSSPNNVSSVTVESKATHTEITGLESGERYYFRIRATNEKGESSWTAIKSLVIGKEPAAPTTWSSATTVKTGEPLNLYWVHNSEDGSSQVKAILELTIDGNTTTKTITNSTDEDEKDKTSVYSVSTKGYKEGVQLKWRVRTCGITGKYGEWSVQRTVDIYSPPVLEVDVTDTAGELIEILTGFPFYISCTASPDTQTPIGYSVNVVANETYETVDDIGNEKIVSAGDEVYSKYFNSTERLMLEMSAGNIDLENNIEYTVKCTVSMNSGLTAESEYTFDVGWDETQYDPDAEIGIDEETVSAYIHPFCEDEDGEPIEGVLLSVYRREFNGAFTELASDIENGRDIFVTDPHPALDYARYRIVATSKETGAVSYYDVPGYPVGEKAVIIQWDEAWSNFDTTNEDALEQPAWSGSLLRLPYNIDVSDKHKSDVALVNYIGRTYPVTYYGTHVDVTSSWSVEIPKNDEETLYALRRLCMWMGDVYVREPSGSGYWATISVSFSQKHCEVTIPVSLEIARVEGGV